MIRDGKIVIFSSHQMSYVEEFCEDIVIINHGEVVLSGHLDTIKRDFGKDQLVLSALDLSPEEFTDQLQSRLSDIVQITGQTKEDMIVRLNEGVSRRELLAKLSQMEDISIEHFETYKPSLNDIFVARAGE